MREKEKEQFIGELQALTGDVIRLFQHMDREEKSRFGVTMTQSYTLQNIYCCEKLTMNQLSDRMGLTTSTMTRIVDNLVRDGYIERIRDEVDRRLVYVSLTPEGMKLAEELRACTRGCFESIVSNISAEDRTSVVRGIEVFLQAMKCSHDATCEVIERKPGLEKVS